MNPTFKNPDGMVIDREAVINLVQMHSLIKLIATYEDPLTPEGDAGLAQSSMNALVKEIEENVPRGEA
jgi:hypothetical protein